MSHAFKCLALAAALALPLVIAPAAHADDGREAVYKDMQAVFGGVPSFVKQLPTAALAGLWQEEKDLELSDKTALPPKTKALISLAVGAQIPCSYCVWLDTMAAKRAGASDEEIGEAVAMSGLTRNWSTMFHGLQVDFDTLKKEMGGP